jgi:hypothetical protein
MMADPLGENGTAGSIGDRAEGGEHQQDSEEMFPVGSLEGEGPDIRTLVKKGLPVELHFSLSKAEVPNRGTGLFDPNKYGRALVTFLPAAAPALPLRGDDGDPAKVTGWKVTQNLRVTHVQAATDVAALVRSEFEALAATDPVGAGRLLDQLQELAERTIRQVA